MASSPAASSPALPQTPTNATQPSQPQAARERSISSVPLAKRFKADHNDVPAPAPSLNGASAAADAGTTQATSSTSKSGAAAAPEQKDNFDSLVDVMGASGVDLQAEEDIIQRREQLRQQQSQRNRDVQPDDDELFLQVYPLAYKVHTLAQGHGLSVDAAVLNYLSLAARTRLKNVLESMIASSRHRSWGSHQHPPPLFPEGRPMYHEQIISDPVKQLAALEKAERGEEARRRRERLARDSEAVEAADGIEEVDEGAAKKRPKKIGPGVAARNMSEDVRKRLADSTAMRNLGGGSSKYSWLSGGSTFPSSTFSPLGSKMDDGQAGGSRLPKPKFAPQPAVNWSGAGGADAGTGAWGDVAARQAAKEEEERQARLKVTLRDALFALEYERRAGVGHGSGEGLLYRIRSGDEGVLKAKEA